MVSDATIDFAKRIENSDAVSHKENNSRRTQSVDAALDPSTANGMKHWSCR